MNTTATEIDGATIHVLHAPSPEPGAVPLVLTCPPGPDLLVDDLRRFVGELIR